MKAAVRIARQRGSILLIAVALIVAVSALAAAFTALYVSDTASSADHASAAQALVLAESGLERALYALRTGTACNALNFTDVALGNGSFTTSGTLHQLTATSLTAAINAASTVIPVAATAGYAPHGRITVEAEQIDYAGITATSLTGARRGANGTTAVAHAVGRPVSQDLCLVRSTGTVGAGRRVVEAAAASAGGGTRSDAFDGGTVNVGTGFVNLGALASPTFPAASTNVVIAAVALENLNTTPGNNPIPRINGGQMQLRIGGTTLASNQYAINVGAKPGASPSAQNFAREMTFLLGRQANAPANPTYLMQARASTGGAITGELKMVAINNPPSSFLRTGNANNATVAGSNVINNQTFTGPAGDRVLVAAVQVYNNIGNAPNVVRTIPAGGIRLRKGNAGGPILAQNEFPVDIVSERTTGPAAQRVYASNRSTSLLLVARDPTSGNNQRYTLQVAVAPFGGGNSSVSARGQVLTVGLGANVAASLLDGAPVAVGAAETVIGSLASTFASGEQVVIGAVQYQNPGAAVRSIGPGNERLVVNNLTQAVSQYGLDLCGTPTSVLCDDFASGLLWRTQAGAANPTFDVRALASGPGINAEAKILALRMPGGINVIDWLEVVQ